ncbi:MAG: hypothetical protein IBX64_14000, partial [Actinobacteria bacterium]|nr:hypothetical protein [Actinomycetota bacterium]
SMIPVGGYVFSGVKVVRKVVDDIPEVVSKTGNKSPSKAYHYTPSTNAESIAKKGLVSEGSIIYTTPNSSLLSPLQAQIDLALRPNRGLPGAVYEIDLDALRRAGIEVSDSQLVGRMNNMPGGGQEMLIYTNKIPPEMLRRIR